jgi:hypothetical protein
MGITVKEHAATNIPATEASGSETRFLVSEPKYLMITSLGRNATIAPASRNAGTRQVRT